MYDNAIRLFNLFWLFFIFIVHVVLYIGHLISADNKLFDLQVRSIH